ncbi:hypothetical protein [Streptomyces sp. NPDC056821]|uniref:hypothetical protein n=1 Tax=unclassified Streptomyces TaxID=2593676 RepID=UPI00367873F9
MHPGIRLLLELGAARPELLLTGQTLTDQGRVVTVMLEAGWSREQLRHVIAARPRAAQAHLPPAIAADHHDTPAWDDPPPQSTSSAAARTVCEALTYRALVECAGCGVPGTAPGEDLCPACRGWPPSCPRPRPPARPSR